MVKDLFNRWMFHIGKCFWIQREKPCSTSRMHTFLSDFVLVMGKSKSKSLEHLQGCSVCDPAKMFFTSKFSYVLFLQTPLIKLKLRQQICGGLLIAKPPRPITMMGQSESLSSSYIIFFTLFSAGAQCLLLHLLSAAATYAIMLRQNYFPEPNWHSLDFLHPILLITYGELLGMLLIGATIFSSILRPLFWRLLWPSN
jgi:hypothetical protein